MLVPIGGPAGSAIRVHPTARHEAFRACRVGLAAFRKARGVVTTPLRKYLVRIASIGVRFVLSWYHRNDAPRSLLHSGTPFAFRRRERYSSDTPGGFHSISSERLVRRGRYAVNCEHGLKHRVRRGVPTGWVSNKTTD